MKRILITGGAGFIGSHLVEHILKNTDWDVTVLDRLTYASSGFDRLRDIQAFDDRRVRIFTADMTHAFGEGLRRELGEPDYVVHMAAETHVDNSIKDPWPFIQSNVVGTYRILEWARRLSKLEKMIYFSTDEVFGPAPDGVRYKEWDRYNSTNPYSATKAAGEELCLAWANTFKVPVFVTHTMNAYGQRQAVEKYVPSLIRKISIGETVTVHADASRTVPGSRFYIHARNIADAVLFLLARADVREKYNIVGEEECDNLRLARLVADELKQPLRYELVDFHSSRPGHDLRYALSGDRLTSMGWQIPKGFEQSLRETVRWSIAPENRMWLEP